MTPEAIQLKLATSAMVKGVGGVEAAAGFCRVGKTVLSDYGSVNRADCFVPLDVVAALEPLARARDGWPHVTRALCTTMGGVFVALPDVDVATHDLLTLLGVKARESGQLTSAICAAVGDGRIDAREAAEIVLEADDLMAAAAAIRATALALVREER